MKNVHKGYGAILGDMMGAPYELKPIYSREFDLINPDNHFTDDTIMTIATMDAILLNPDAPDFRAAYKKWGRKYFGDYYGAMFKDWIMRDDDSSNPSYGNGAAMRISPIAYLTDIDGDRSNIVIESVVTSHRSMEAMMGSVAYAGTLSLAINKADLEDIEKENKEFFLQYYPESLVPFDKFTSHILPTTATAIKCFIDAEGDTITAIRTAVSLGGDCDTIASMAAELCVAYNGSMNSGWAMYVEKHLPEDMLKVLKEFNEKF